MKSHLEISYLELGNLEQMELEFFVKPGTDEKWHQYWLDQRLKWWSKQGIASDKLKLLQVEKEELSHYSRQHLILCINFHMVRGT